MLDMFYLIKDYTNLFFYRMRGYEVRDMVLPYLQRRMSYYKKWDISCHIKKDDPMSIVVQQGIFVFGIFPDENILDFVVRSWVRVELHTLEERRQFDNLIELCGWRHCGKRFPYKETPTSHGIYKVVGYRQLPVTIWSMMQFIDFSTRILPFINWKPIDLHPHGDPIDE